MADPKPPSVASIIVMGLTVGGLSGVELGQRVWPALERSENGTLVAVGIGAAVGGLGAFIITRLMKREQAAPQPPPQP